MSNLLSSLGNSAAALDAYDRVLAVTQNNVSNASTPGYAKQRLTLEALPLDLTLGSLGGVRAGPIQSSRDQYAEQAVRRQTAGLGQAQQEVNSLSNLQAQFDVSGKTGIPAALNQLFQSFSAWGQNPGDSTVRQTVIDQAGTLASTFRQTATGLAQIAQDTRGQLRQTVDDVNHLVGNLRNINVQILGGAKNDPGVDANLNSTLEQLSQYIDFTSIQQPDGSMTLLLNGQTPLLAADQAYNLRCDFQQPAATDPFPDGPTSAHIYASDGRDATTNSAGGQLGALLKVYNDTLPSYLGDATHAGDVNTMAEQFASRVNELLTSGEVTDGDTPQAGVALFQYDATNHTRVAETLAVDPSVKPEQLGAIDPGPPEVSNGIPLALAGLADPVTDQDKVNSSVSYSAFYGSMAARAGSAWNDASSQLQNQQSTLAQAKDLRQQISGVSLDEEATIMIQFQRAYEANSRMITILDQLTQDTINILTT